MTHKQKELCRMYIVLGTLSAFILGAVLATYFGQ
jgi:hypothetical protein